MATTLPPQTGPALDPVAHAAGLRRTRMALVAGFLVMFGSIVWFLTYSADAVAKHEARVVAGDFPVLREATGAMEVDEHGRVVVGGFLQNPPLTVASTRLVPPGKYKRAIVANDGVEAHRKKTELVIGAQDEKGAWHPASAAAVLARMNAPRERSPQ